MQRAVMKSGLGTGFKSFLSCCIQFCRQHVNIAFQHALVSANKMKLQYALVSAIEMKITLARDACFKPSITIRSQDLHVDAC
jgi:hypothetical protein